MININPLDVLKKREVNFKPPHYTEYKLNDSDFYTEKIRDWIIGKLKGRFYLKRSPGMSKDDKLKVVTILGFEDPKEMTYFMLACPYIRRN